MTPVLAQIASQAHAAGNPLYRVMPHHLPGLLAVVLVPVALWLVRRRAQTGGRLAGPLVLGYRRLPVHRRALCWLLLIAAATHLGLVAAGERPLQTVLFALDAVALTLVVRRLVLGRSWRLWSALLLAGSLFSYAVAVVASEPPDQLGVAAKLVELTALAIVLRPHRATRVRQLLASAATVSLVVTIGLAAWAGAFAAASRGPQGDGHHGLAPAPGTLIAAVGERAPTYEERTAADRFYRHAVAALRKYRDTAVAAAAGFQVHGIVGTDFHASNPRYAKDGRIFDPARPENLIYAQTSRGPALLGALYEMPSIGRPGPTIGGPLTEWHAHENVCISLLPFALSGLESPFGGCPAASILIPITPPMIHLWLIPGVSPRFGDLDDKRRAAYIRSFAAGKLG